ncbi:MAG: hypothetical protein R3F48_03675 [Candidatus Zixiibacteriota bacterium]
MRIAICLLVLTVCFTALSYSQEENYPPYLDYTVEPPWPHIFHEGQMLAIAYIYNDTTYLNGFFDYWENESLPICDSEYAELPIIEKSIYDIFQVFFKPDTTLYLKIKNNRSMDEQEKRCELNFNAFYEHAEYLIIQCSVPYEIVSNYDSVMQSDIFLNNVNVLVSDTLKDFRPDIRIGEKKILYLHSKYENALEDYLRHSGRYNNCDKRYFISDKVQITLDNWGCDYLYETLPRIYNVIFNETLSKAVINYQPRHGYGAEVEYIRSETGWKKSRVIAIMFS